MTNLSEKSALSLDALGAMAQGVARTHQSLEDAGADARAGAAEVLQEVLDRVKPAARALSSPVALSSTISPDGTSVVPAKWRGIYLDGQGPIAVDRSVAPLPYKRGEIRYERGRHGGARLMMRDDGQLVELVYDGPWSNVPGEISSWTATPREISPAEALTRHRLDYIVMAIGEALVAYADGKAPQRAAELRGQASRLKALALLVRGM